MTYGAYLTNENGNTIVGEGETGLLYWGKIEVSRTSTGTQYISLFNLPDHIQTAVAIHTKDLGIYGGGVVWNTLTRNGVHHVKIDAVTDTGQVFEFYVFVEAGYVPRAAYGMEVYYPNGQVQWHTGRPTLSLKHVENHSWATWIAPNTYRPAVLTQAYYRTVRGGREEVTVDEACVTAYESSPGVYRVGPLRVTYTTPGYDSAEYYPNDTYMLAVIDADYYSQFTNLGNY